MATFQDFPESNTLWRGNGGDVGDLPAHRSPQQHCSISCWKLTPEELFEVVNTGVVWLYVYGKGHPPVLVYGHNPFRVAEQQKEADDGQDETGS